MRRHVGILFCVRWAYVKTPLAHRGSSNNPVLTALSQSSMSDTHVQPNSLSQTQNHQHPMSWTCFSSDSAAPRIHILTGAGWGVCSVKKKWPLVLLFSLVSYMLSIIFLSPSSILSQLSLSFSLPLSCSTSHSHRQGHTEACYFPRRAHTTFTRALKHLHSNTHLANSTLSKPVTRVYNPEKCVCVAKWG